MVPQTDGADVSVIMPAFRAEETIRRALVSIARQTVRPLEVIVVDDGSDDGTSVVAQSSAANERINLILLRQTKSGPGAARNAALKIAKGRFLAFLDADDEWLPRKLEFALNNIGSRILLAHNMLTVSPQGHERLVDSARNFPRFGDPFVALFKRGFIATSTVLLRRDALNAVSGFDAGLPSGQDYELWLRIASVYPEGLGVLPEALTRYHVTSGSITQDIGTRRRCAIEIAARHASLLRPRAGRKARGIFIARLAIITYEASVAYVRTQRFWKAIVTLASLPFVIARLWRVI